MDCTEESFACCCCRLKLRLCVDYIQKKLLDFVHNKSRLTLCLGKGWNFKKKPRPEKF